jgi:hypothetical protein
MQEKNDVDSLTRLGRDAQKQTVDGERVEVTDIGEDEAVFLLTFPGGADLERDHPKCVTQICGRLSARCEHRNQIRPG